LWASTRRFHPKLWIDCWAVSVERGEGRSQCPALWPSLVCVRVFLFVIFSILLLMFMLPFLVSFLNRDYFQLALFAIQATDTGLSYVDRSIHTHLRLKGVIFIEQFRNVWCCQRLSG
jgi:hypothetical protein